MSTAVIQEPRQTTPVVESVATPVVALKRRTIDSILIAAGAVATDPSGVRA